MSDPGQVTELLRRFQGGDRQALDQVYPLVYDELRIAARRALTRERDGSLVKSDPVVPLRVSRFPFPISRCSISLSPSPFPLV